MTISRRRWLSSAPFTLLPATLPSATAAPSPIDEQWRRIAATIDGSVGAAAVHLKTGQRAALHAGQPFPLASVCKVPIAMQMLALVDEGKYSLHSRIEILARDVRPWVSPVAERWPKQQMFPLDELLLLMFTESDNTAVDALLRVGGGPAAIGARLAKWRAKGVRIDRPEGLCGLNAAGYDTLPDEADWTPKMFDDLFAKATPEMRAAGMRRFLADVRDTGTPEGTTDLLARAFRGELLLPKTTAYLIEIMEATRTGRKRLKGLLPAGTVVAHKTGTTATAGKLNGGTNDAGVVTLPNGHGQFAIAVYVKGSTAGVDAIEEVIARIAKAAFEAWS